MDEEQGPPPRLFTPLYWMALAFGVAMILAGAAVGLFGAGWLTHRAVKPGRARFDSAPGAWQGAARLSRSSTVFQHEVLVGQSRTGDQAGLPKLPSQVL